MRIIFNTNFEIGKWLYGDSSIFLKRKFEKFPLNGLNKYSKRLKLPQVKMIKKLYSSGKYTQADLAKTYKVDSSTISNIWTGKRWKSK
jgi:DNA-binding XRE family transcriptional regulator